MDFDISE